MSHVAGGFATPLHRPDRRHELVDVCIELLRARLADHEVPSGTGSYSTLLHGWSVVFKSLCMAVARTDQ
eukprot:10419821-Alexandrium_andersonii.AAC.1